jgi:cytoskeleton protein RodZ
MSVPERTKMRLAMSMSDERSVDFGTFLRQAREKRGVSLQQVAVATKISVHTLESLERNDPSKLPGGIFSRAFVRAYAREVGLDPEAAVSSFVSAFPEASGAEDMPVAATAEEAETYEGRRKVATTVVRLAGITLLVLVLGLIGYTLWQRHVAKALPASDSAAGSAAQMQTAPVPAESPAGTPPAQPERESAAAPASEVPAPGVASPGGPATQPQQATPGPQPTAPGTAAPQQPAAQEPAAQQQAVQQPPAQQPAAQETVAPPPPATSAAVTPAQLQTAPAATAAPIVVDLAASGSCWIAVTVDGKATPQRILVAGDRIQFEGSRYVTLHIGNAGSLSMTLNGKPAKSLGGEGQAATITVTADSLASFLR